MPLPSDFHSHHAPWGAFASFTCGFEAARVVSGGGEPPPAGGFGQSLRGPARQNLFVGWRRGGGAWSLLPFFAARRRRDGEFTAAGPDGSAGREEPIEVAAGGAVVRSFGYGTDAWEMGPMGFALHTPVDPVPDLSRRGVADAAEHCAPVVVGTLTGDNTEGTRPLELIFGVGMGEQAWRPLAESAPDLAGFAAGGRFGFAAVPGSVAEVRQGFDVFSPWRRGDDGLLRLGGEAAVVFRVPPGQRKEFPLALGFFVDGRVTTGLEARFFYRRHFDSLEEVLRHGVQSWRARRKRAAAADARLLSSGLGEERRWLVAQAIRSYVGATELLERDGKPLWVVNEGEYRMMNTFDLTVDHLYLELDHWPWALRDTLDLFASRYSYTAGVKSPNGRKAAGGVSFTHDMGVDDQFTPPGVSSYELPRLTDCFSHMTAEQLLNWILCAVTYVVRSGDLTWLRRKRELLADCVTSLRRRDAPKASERDGILDWDSARCGDAGSEITTYDSLDTSLGQARRNLYLGVKAWAAWVLVAEAYRRMGDREEAAGAETEALRMSAALADRFDDAAGAFPAVFEPGNTSRILPAIEGLVYPLEAGLTEAVDRDGPHGRLHRALARHLGTVLRRGVCLDAESGGWKLSSSSENTWVSKIQLCQHVAARLFPDVVPAEARGPADAAHVAWLTGPVARTQAFSDQLRSTDGHPLGSRYYPRGVTNWLWWRGGRAD